MDGCCDYSPERLATFENAHDFCDFHDFQTKAYVFNKGLNKKDNIFTTFCADFARLHIFTVKIW